MRWCSGQLTLRALELTVHLLLDALGFPELILQLTMTRNFYFILIKRPTDSQRSFGAMSRSQRRPAVQNATNLSHPAHTVSDF